MTESIDPRAKHGEHIQQRTEYVRGKRGPVSYVWGNHVLNPAFGLATFEPQFVHWHKSWLGAVPADYVTFSASALRLIAYSRFGRRPGVRCHST